MQRHIVVCAACLFLAFATPSYGADGAVLTAQNIISAQIDAFLKDDAQRAYSYASPGIQQMYPSPDIFFEMVKRAYGPVYRPGNYAFGRSEMTANGVTQEVLIHASDGQDWTALYTLERQSDGSFKISSVHMIKSAPPST